MCVCVKKPKLFSTRTSNSTNKYDDDDDDNSNNDDNSEYDDKIHNICCDVTWYGKMAPFLIFTLGSSSPQIDLLNGNDAMPMTAGLFPLILI